MREPHALSLADWCCASKPHIEVLGVRNPNTDDSCPLARFLLAGMPSKLVALLEWLQLRYGLPVSMQQECVYNNNFTILAAHSSRS